METVLTVIIGLLVLAIIIVILSYSRNLKKTNIALVELEANYKNSQQEITTLQESLSKAQAPDRNPTQQVTMAQTSQPTSVNLTVEPTSTVQQPTEQIFFTKEIKFFPGQPMINLNIEKGDENVAPH